MPFEIFGVDLSQREGRDEYLEAYSYLEKRGANRHLDGLDFTFDVVTEWVETDPEEAREFLVFCSEHQDQTIRRSAAIACNQFIKIDPEFTLSMIEVLLTDHDPVVRSANGYYDNILEGDHSLEDYLEHAGIKGINRLIKAVKISQGMDQSHAGA